MTAPGTGDLVARWVYAERASVESALRGGGAADIDMDDLVQVVALAAVRTAEQDRPAWATCDAFRPWLRVVAYRVAVTHAHRAARERQHRLTVPRLAETVSSAEDRCRAAEELRLLERSTTPERWQAVTALAAGEDVSEVAREAGLTVPGVYSRAHVARQDFAAALHREATAPRVRRNR